jgi:hypothetical protein
MTERLQASSWRLRDDDLVLEDISSLIIEPEDPQEQLHNGDWISLSEQVEFLPLMGSNGRPEAQTSRRDNQFFSSSSSTANLDSLETFYDPYSQAWRYLGFYIDCNTNNNNNDRDHHRALGGEDNNQAKCRRYLLWAAVSRVV